LLPKQTFLDSDRVNLLASEVTNSADDSPLSADHVAKSAAEPVEKKVVKLKTGKHGPTNE